MLKRLFIYPSILVCRLRGRHLGLPEHIQLLSGLHPGPVGRSFATHLSFIAAWHFIVPLCIVFGTALVAGLIIRKYLAATEPE